MKVLLVNGSPKAKGCTYTALQEAAAALEKQGIETEIFQVGTQPVAGCVGCGVCRKNGECFRNDVVNEFVNFLISYFLAFFNKYSTQIIFFTKC